MKFDSVGAPFKEAEKDQRTVVPNDPFLVVRLDGKAFHTFTRNAHKPFDVKIAKAMEKTTLYLCKSSDVPAKFAYTQSDEISLILDQRTGDQWYGGQTQKIVSVAASYASAYFNTIYPTDLSMPAVFDGRVFTLKSVEELVEYLKWRKSDANRNAISSVAQSLYSHKELHGKPKSVMLDMIHEKDSAQLPIPSRDFNGAYFFSVLRPRETSYTDKSTGEDKTVEVMRRIWVTGYDPFMLPTVEKLMADEVVQGHDTYADLSR